MRAAVIINPASGRHGRRPGSGSERDALAREAVRLARLDDADVEIVLTRAPGHAVDLARGFVARGAGVVIAWGGDGTVNEVAGPLIGSRTALGIVPSGSGDGLARGLGLPRRPERALRLALVGPRRPMDTGLLGDRHFLNIAGIGFDASVGTAFNRAPTRGRLRYARFAAGAVWRYECAPYSVRLDDLELAGPRFLVAFANGPQYGNGVVVAPEACLDDGWLDAVVVAGGSPIRQWWRARRVLWRPRRAAEGIVRIRLRTGSVSGERLVCHVDGETFEASGTLDVRVRPASIIVAGRA